MRERVQKDMAGAVAALDYDAELMLRVKDGDSASFAVLLEKHRSPVVHFLYRMVQNQAVAEELAQEVFLRVYRSRSSYEPAGQVHHLVVSHCHAPGPELHPRRQARTVAEPAG